MSNSEAPRGPLTFMMSAPTHLDEDDPYFVPPEPPKLRTKPQKRDIGPGKIFPDRAAFQADLDAWNAERANRKACMDDRERHLKRLRNAHRDRRQVAQRRASAPPQPPSSHPLPSQPQTSQPPFSQPPLPQPQPQPPTSQPPTSQSQPPTSQLPTSQPPTSQPPSQTSSAAPGGVDGRSHKSQTRPGFRIRSYYCDATQPSWNPSSGLPQDASFNPASLPVDLSTDTKVLIERVLDLLERAVHTLRLACNLQLEMRGIPARLDERDWYNFFNDLTYRSYRIGPLGEEKGPCVKRYRHMESLQWNASRFALEQPERSCFRPSALRGSAERMASLHIEERVRPSGRLSAPPPVVLPSHLDAAIHCAKEDAEKFRSVEAYDPSFASTAWTAHTIQGKVLERVRDAQCALHSAVSAAAQEWLGYGPISDDEWNAYFTLRFKVLLPSTAAGATAVYYEEPGHELSCDLFGAFGGWNPMLHVEAYDQWVSWKNGVSCRSSSGCRPQLVTNPLGIGRGFDDLRESPIEWTCGRCNAAMCADAVLRVSFWRECARCAAMRLKKAFFSTERARLAAAGFAPFDSAKLSEEVYRRWVGGPGGSGGLGAAAATTGAHEAPAAVEGGVPPAGAAVEDEGPPAAETEAEDSSDSSSDSFDSEGSGDEESESGDPIAPIAPSPPAPPTSVHGPARARPASFPCPGSGDALRLS